MTLGDCQSHRQFRATDDSAGLSIYSPDLLSDGEMATPVTILGSDQAILAKLYGIPVPPAIFRTTQAANSEIMRQLSNTPGLVLHIPIVFSGLIEVGPKDHESRPR